MRKFFYILILSSVAIGLSACTSPSDNQAARTLSYDNQAASTLPGDNNIIINQDLININNNDMNIIDSQENLLQQYSQATIKTSQGDITVKLYNEDSPVTVNNFLNLAKSGFYNQTKFHRVIKDFMIQGGDPLSKESDVSVYGTGGPGYKFADEFNSHKLVAGSLAMANSGPNTNGSQFFIVTASETPWLDGRHTNFGEVISGLDVVKKIEAVQTGANDRPLEPVTILSIELEK